MRKKTSAIIISKNRRLCQDITSRLAPVIGDFEVQEDIAAAYSYIKENQPETVFFDMTKSRQGFLKFTARIKKSMPGTRIFFICPQKDPDLILAGFRAGIADFFLYPFNGSGISESVRRSLAVSAGRHEAEIFTVFSLKGGTGVTTIAMNLAHQIRELTTDRVLLLDLNLFIGDVCSYLNLGTSYSPYDFIQDIDRMDTELLFSSLLCHQDGFHILTTPEEISDSDSISPEMLMQMLSILKQNFDYIIVDSPHDFSDRTLKVCTASDRILVLVQQNIPSAKTGQKVIEFFRELGFDDNKVNMVINRYLKTGEMEDNDFENIFRKPVFFRVDNNYPFAAKAAARGMTLGQAGKHHKITVQIRHMAEKLTGISSREPAGLRRFLQRRLIP